MDPVATPRDEWKTLPWRELERAVFKLQKRIFRPSQRGDRKTVHRLQRLLMKSWAARCLAVRKVTQDNRGKRTAGVDGVKNLAPPQRLALAADLPIRPTGRADGAGRLLPVSARAGFHDTDRPPRSRVRGNSHARF